MIINITDQFFGGIPPYIWKGIFSVLKVLFVGLVLGLFAAKYQKRKEVEHRIKGDILMKRLETFEKINSLFCRIRGIIAPPLYKQRQMEDYLNGLPFVYQHIEYSSFFDTEDAFDVYYTEMKNLINTEHVFFDFGMEKRMSSSINTLTQIKLMLDAFSDMEQCNKYGFTKEQADEHITLAYQLTGVAMSNEINGIYCKMDQYISYRMRHISLAYKESKIKIALWRIWEDIYKKIEYWYEGSTEQRKVFKLLTAPIVKKQAPVLYSQAYLLIVLMRVHYSSWYTLDKFDEQSDNSILTMTKNFYDDFKQFYHA